MDRFRSESSAQARAWWQRFSLLDRGKKEFDLSLDRFLGTDDFDCDILFVPDDLATADPSRLHELEGGHFGLDGILVDLAAQPSVFAAELVDDAFRRALHGFAWLRDLDAIADDGDEGDAAARWAQQLVFDWIDRHPRVEGLPFAPDVLTRRIRSLLAHANLVTRRLDERRRRRFVRTLAGQVAVLREHVRSLPQGEEKLSAFAALALAGICLSRHTELEAEAVAALQAELAAQIRPDGSHLSRNGAVLLQLLFDLLPLRRCFIARDHRTPAGIAEAIDRMRSMARFLRMGDGSLARFNGVGATPTDALAILFAADERKSEPVVAAPDSGYARLAAGPAVLVCDVAPPPPLAHAGAAHAGCLSFELSIRHFALVVNVGACGSDDDEWRRFTRSTGAHSTLAIDDLSQGGFEATGELAGPRGVRPIGHGADFIEASHNGYAAQFGVVHRRRLVLAGDGLRLDGSDRLEPAGNAGAGDTRPPCRIRFHLHPAIAPSAQPDGTLQLTLPDGEVWRFAAESAPLVIADSVHVAQRGGVEPTRQIVLEAEARPGLELLWRFEQVHGRPPLPAAGARTG